ncbi:Sodium channel protein 60E [Symbiodinium microadriaticum]|uniref:Sodium channel protein 60E n=1 Tax=Symbiodinium microadriaticum TaxID=2951 RepID=A0A1Q9DMX7_SYMMI|nr:Sodium channel protein 60E [Symbiodinium microadriaticum]
MTTSVTLAAPTSSNRGRLSAIGAALDGAVDALTMTPGSHHGRPATFPDFAVPGGQGATELAELRARAEAARATASGGMSAYRRRISSQQSLLGSLEGVADNQGSHIEWDLRSEEKALEKLPWTRGRAFSFIVSSIIFLNTVWLGLETDYYDERNYVGQVDPWRIVNYTFVGFFVIELVIRIYSRSWWPFIADNWNKFDFGLVLLSLMDTFLLEQISDSAGSLSSLRVLRVLRVARVLRLLRFFKPLWLLVIGAVDAMRALLWAWVLISILIYIFAILLTRTVGFAHRGASEDVDKYFGNLLYSCFTLFQVMTLEGWPDAARAATDVEPWVWIVFVAFLLITTFSIMNMIVSVIVESTLEAALDQKLQAMRDQEYQTTMAAVKVDEVFRRADGNGDGHITKEELMQALLKPDVRLYLREVGIDITNAEFIFDVIDYDGSGELEYKEFALGLVKARGEAKAQEVLALQCDLWRRERTLRKELQTVCVTVDSRMRSIDDALESLRNDLQVVDSALRMRSLQLQ